MRWWKKTGMVVLCVCLILLNLPLNVGGQEQTTGKNDPLNLYAKSAVLMDAQSRRVLYQKNGEEPRAMASTTKIMTCLLALECGDPESVVTFSTYAASMPKVKLGASSGSCFYLKDLLYSMMLESHNDTAVAIAEHLGGSVENFAQMMNRRADEIGAKHTHFVTPNGLDAPGHSTTACDLALITAEAIQNEELMKIINTREYHFCECSGKREYHVTNKNAFLEMMDGAIGVKTGFTGEAGYCFVGALKKQNKTLISVVLGSGWPPNKNEKWKDTIKLMKYGVDNYEYRVIFSGIPDYQEIPVTDGIRKQVGTYIDGELSTLLSDNDQVSFRYEFPRMLAAPVVRDQPVGKLRIFINQEEFCSFAIRTKEQVKKIEFPYIFKSFILAFFCVK